MLEIKDISKKLGEFQLKDFSLKISRGDYFMLLGPSGAGKSVVLESIAGIITPDSGSIWLDGIDITTCRMQNRNIGMVFQGNTIFPHMSVKENLSYPLKIKGISSATRKDIVSDNAERVGISHLLDRMPANLSGGETQRVIIARTLGSNTKCLLLDEPLSSIDVQIKENLIDLLRRLNQEGLTILHVTHDFHEAFSLANQMAVIDKGRLLQTGTPLDISKNPASGFVASFIGMHNYFEGKKGQNGMIILENNIILKTKNIPEKDHFQILIPPAAIQFDVYKQGLNDTNTFKGTIKRRIDFPDYTELYIDLGILLRFRLPLSHPLSPIISAGSHVTLQIIAERIVPLENH